MTCQVVGDRNPFYEKLNGWAEVLVLTSTSILNHTTEDFLELCRHRSKSRHGWSRALPWLPRSSATCRSTCWREPFPSTRKPFSKPFVMVRGRPIIHRFSRKVHLSLPGQKTLMEVHVKAQQERRYDDLDGNVVRINGRVRKPLVLSMEELCAMETEVFEDLFIVCGSGDPKGCIGSCRGVLARRYHQESRSHQGRARRHQEDVSRCLSRRRLQSGLFVAGDFQYSRLAAACLDSSGDGSASPCDQERKRVDLISAQDYFMGSRYVKGLTNIEVAMVGSQSCGTCGERRTGRGASN